MSNRTGASATEILRWALRLDDRRTKARLREHYAEAADRWRRGGYATRGLPADGARYADTMRWVCAEYEARVDALDFAGHPMARLARDQLDLAESRLLRAQADLDALRAAICTERAADEEREYSLDVEMDAGYRQIAERRRQARAEVDRLSGWAAWRGA